MFHRIPDKFSVSALIRRVVEPPSRPCAAPMPMPRNSRLNLMSVGDTDSFTPSAQRPVRVRARAMAADSHFEPHSHAWAQLAYCASGIVQVTAAQSPAPRQRAGETTYIVPPSRAVWIAPGARHHITVLEQRNCAPSTCTPAPPPKAGRAAACWWSRRCCAS